MYKEIRLFPRREKRTNSMPELENLIKNKKKDQEIDDLIKLKPNYHSKLSNPKSGQACTLFAHKFQVDESIYNEITKDKKKS